jgi:ferric-dicitrate binding protein FerR (iron transport regulator)
MKRPTDAQALLEQWRQAPDLETPSVLDHGAQIRAVSGVLGRVAERRASRLRQRKQWSFAALAAGVIGVTIGGWQLVREDRSGVERAGVRVERASAGVALLASDGALLAARRALFDGERIETHAGDAELGFPSGARVQVTEQSSVRVVHALEDEAFFLSSGKVDVEVPKLGAGQFSVRTPDARVVVHGTHFSVAVGSRAGQPQTRVEVSRGLVSVETGAGEVWLSAGQHWPTEEASRAAADPPLAPSLAAAPEARAAELPASKARQRAPLKAAARPGAGRTPRRAPATPAALAEQNRRFARAMELKKQEQLADALLELDRLEQAYPRSVFDQELLVERFRLLEHLGRHREAARAARAYLGDYPNGYAGQEAREIALGAE